MRWRPGRRQPRRLSSSSFLPLVAAAIVAPGPLPAAVLERRLRSRCRAPPSGWLAFAAGRELGCCRQPRPSSFTADRLGRRLARRLWAEAVLGSARALSGTTGPSSGPTQEAGHGSCPGHLRLLCGLAAACRPPSSWRASFESVFCTSGAPCSLCRGLTWRRWLSYQTGASQTRGSLARFARFRACARPSLNWWAGRRASGSPRSVCATASQRRGRRTTCHC